MTTYTHRHVAPEGWSRALLSRVGAGLCRKLAAGLKAVQYTQLVSELYQMPDTYLNEAGLRRHDIPNYARRAIYGEE